MDTGILVLTMHMVLTGIFSIAIGVVGRFVARQVFETDITGRPVTERGIFVSDTMGKVILLGLIIFVAGGVLSIVFGEFEGTNLYF